jgi:hypothetical protein
MGCRTSNTKRKKYEEGTLITKYESKNIEPLKEEDIIKPSKSSERREKRRINRNKEYNT